MIIQVTEGEILEAIGEYIGRRYDIEGEANARLSYNIWTRSFGAEVELDGNERKANPVGPS